MGVFFHAKSCGFFTDEVHGPRTVMVPDPDWTAPKVLIPNPLWVADESDPTKEADLVEADNPDAYPPQVEIPNPDCTLPPVKELRAITDAEYLTLLDAQTQGKIIQAGAKGAPVAVDPLPPSESELIERERIWRDQALAATDSLVVRHRDELEVGRPTTLTGEQFTQLQNYRLDLRDWPGSELFPDSQHRPAPPIWLGDANL
ncbi:phage tail protein [Pseudomonas veronii]|uniref:phage tail protein n=1 Tax=Pseudomonas veronii TaxID=76761 RepID=UPI000F82F2EF|nr:phage tail protein [Pseudomonas veronii]RTY69855.1 phage tail protein [Pseudomonas veronii]